MAFSDGYWFRRAKGMVAAFSGGAEIDVDDFKVSACQTATDGSSSWLLQRHAFYQNTGAATGAFWSLAAAGPLLTPTPVALPGTMFHAQGVNNDGGERLIFGATRPGSDCKAAAWSSSPSVWTQVIDFGISGHDLNCGGCWKTTYGGNAYLAVVCDATAHEIFLVGDVTGKITESVISAPAAPLSMRDGENVPVVEACRTMTSDSILYLTMSPNAGGTKWVLSGALWTEANGPEPLDEITLEFDTDHYDGSAAAAGRVLVHPMFYAGAHQTLALFTANVIRTSGDSWTLTAFLDHRGTGVGGDHDTLRYIDGPGILCPGVEVTDASSDAGSSFMLAPTGAPGSFYKATVLPFDESNISEWEAVTHGPGGPPLVGNQEPHATGAFVLTKGPTGRLAVFSVSDEGGTTGAWWEWVPVSGAATASTFQNMAYQRGTPNAEGEIEFESDRATVTASSEVAGFDVENVQRFRDLGPGDPWRGETSYHEWLHFDAGADGKLPINYAHLLGARSSGITPNARQAAAMDSALDDVAAGEWEQTVATSTPATAHADGETSLALLLLHFDFGGGGEFFMPALVPAVSIAELAAADVPTDFLAWYSNDAAYTSAPGPVLVAAGAGAAYTWDPAPIAGSTVGAVAVVGDPPALTPSGDAYSATAAAFTFGGDTYNQVLTGGPEPIADALLVNVVQPPADAAPWQLYGPTVELWVGDTELPTIRVGSINWLPVSGDRGRLFTLPDVAGYRYALLLVDNFPYDWETRTADTEQPPIQLSRVVLGKAREMYQNWLRASPSGSLLGRTDQLGSDGGYAVRYGLPGRELQLAWDHVPQVDKARRDWLQLGAGARTRSLWHYGARIPMYLAPAPSITEADSELGELEPMLGWFDAPPVFKRTGANGVRYSTSLVFRSL